MADASQIIPSSQKTIREEVQPAISGLRPATNHTPTADNIQVMADALQGVREALDVLQDVVATAASALYNMDAEACSECPSAALLAHTQSIEQHLVIVRDNGRIEDIRATNPDAIDSITILDIGSDVRDQYPEVKHTFEGLTGVATQWGRPTFTEVDKVKSLIEMLTKANNT